jgi:hypothetical protein
LEGEGVSFDAEGRLPLAGVPRSGDAGFDRPPAGRGSVVGAPFRVSVTPTRTATSRALGVTTASVMSIVFSPARADR